MHWRHFVEERTVFTAVTKPQVSGRLRLRLIVPTMRIETLRAPALQLHLAPMTYSCVEVKVADRPL